MISITCKLTDETRHLIDSDRASVELQRRAAMNLLNLLQGNQVEDSLN